MIISCTWAGGGLLNVPTPKHNSTCIFNIAQKKPQYYYVGGGLWSWVVSGRGVSGRGVMP